MKKGFTLIELLIVITIIGILAVVFLPSIMSAPEKARDAARQADLGNITEAIAAEELAGDTDTTVGTTTDLATSLAGFEEYFGGGILPQDPLTGAVSPAGASEADGQYYVEAGADPITYTIWARMEDTEKYTEDCPDGTTSVCYKVDVY